MGSRQPLLRRSLAMAAALGALALTADPAAGANFLVVTPLDSGVGSLRDAINLANAAGGSNTITINIPLGTTPTITLRTPLPDIAGPLVIDGTPTSRLVIQGPGATAQLVQIAANPAQFLNAPVQGGILLIASGAQLEFNTGGDQTVAERIRDQGSVEKLGTGTLILTGANDFSGGITVTAGTLQGDTGSLPGPISIGAGAALVFNQASDATRAEAISGSGSLAKQGAGTLTLTGANTFAGGTSISAGALRGDVSSLPGDVSLSSGASLIIDQATDATRPGNITGSGSLTKLGAGTLVLSGSNSFTGGTALSAGTLRGGAGNLGSGGIAIAGGAHLVFDQAGDGTQAGTLTGAGDVVKLGAGTLTLTGINHWSGGTSVAEGALRGDAASLPGNFALASGTSLVVAQGVGASLGGTTSLGGAVSGAGSVVKEGPGLVRLFGANSYTGGTRVREGFLEVVSWSPIPGNALVEAAGRIGGTGSIAGDLDVAGSVAPGTTEGLGGALGTLSVAGNVGFGADAVLAVRVDETGGHDELDVGGTASGSTIGLDVLPIAGSYATPVTVDVLRASSVTGAYSVLPQFAFLDTSVTTLPDRVSLTLAFSDRALSSFAQTPNQAEVARALEEVRVETPGALDDVFESLVTLTVPEVPGALDAMSGESITQFTNARLALFDRFDRAVHSRLYDLGTPLPAPRPATPARSPRVGQNGGGAGSELPPVSLPPAGPRGLGAWLDGIGLIGSLDGDSGRHDLDYGIGGVALGMDTRVHPRVALGAALGYAHTDMDVDDLDSSGSGDSVLVSLYGAYSDPRVDLTLSGRYGHHFLESRRGVQFSALDTRARADFDADDGGLHAEGGVRVFSLGAFHYQATGSLSYLHLHREGFLENSPASAGLQVDSEALDSIQTGLGGRFFGAVAADEGWILAPELWGRWIHEFGDVERRLDARLGTTPGTGDFVIFGAQPERDTGALGLRWTMTSQKNLRFALGYSVRINGNFVDHAPDLALQLIW